VITPGARARTRRLRVMGDARSGTIGNFWVDLFRGSFRLLLIW
jgi:K+-transporting ATPase A subunit